MRRLWPVLVAALLFCILCLAPLSPLDPYTAEREEARAITDTLRDAVPRVEWLHEKILEESKKWNYLIDPFRHKMYFVNALSTPYEAEIDEIRAIQKACKERTKLLTNSNYQTVLLDVCLKFRVYYLQTIAFPVKSNDWTAIYEMYDRLYEMTRKELFDGIELAKEVLDLSRKV